MRDLKRFSGAERLLHWSTALSVAILATTGWFIWRKEDDWEIFGINVISQAHVWLGALLLIAGVVAYLVARHPRPPYAEFRFNMGQRLGLRLTQALLAVLMLSGSALYLRSWLHLSKPLRAVIRQVHFDAVIGLLVFTAVHLVMVAKNRGILRAMLTGHVQRSVALQVNPTWVELMAADEVAGASAVNAEDVVKRRQAT